MLNDAINAVVKARENHERLKAEQERLHEDWLIANQEIIEAASAAKAEMLDAETMLRDLAVREYEKTGEKKVAWRKYPGKESNFLRRKRSLQVGIGA